jgi:serine/threonine protein kinase
MSERLGPYEIAGPLGKGGMGEVCKARDTRLDRIVAIKLLRSVTPESRERFRREARTISSLDHPLICHRGLRHIGTRMDQRRCVGVCAGVVDFWRERYSNRPLAIDPAEYGDR